jgi:iron complex outermembrane receptor protein
MARSPTSLLSQVCGAMINRFVSVGILAGTLSLLVVSGALAKEMESSSSNVKQWLAQTAQPQVQITGVRVTATDAGLAITLETSAPLVAPTTSVVGNALIVDIADAVLALPEGEEFLSTDPIEGIALVSVTGLPNNRVRVAVTGVDAPPTGDLSIESLGLVVAVTPGTETAETDEDAIQVVVTGEQEEGYVVDNATTATRTDTPIRDVPQSITVIPRQVLEDQRPNSLTDALRNVSGISSGNSSLQYFESPIIRGFDATQSFFTNGTRNTVGGFSTTFETANVERIEVLRGPASVLYGQAEPGGIINLVTELPLAEPYYAIEGTIGNFDFYSPSIDFSGPLNADRTIRYRLNALYQNSGTFIDFVDIERFFVAPVLSFQLGENTNLIVEGSYQRRSQTSFIIGLPAVGTVFSNPLGEVDRSRFLGDPDFSALDYETTIAGYRLEHEFSDTWSMRNAFRAEFGNILRDRVIGPGQLEADNQTVTRNAVMTTGDRQGYSLQTDVIGTVQTGSIEHDLLFGVELRRVNSEAEQFFGSAPSIDLFNPEYGLPSFDIPISFAGRAQDSFVGVYAQDLITIADNLKLLVGGRFDWVEQRYEYTSPDTAPTFQGDTAFSPRAGIVYQPIEPISLYASYSRSFNPEGSFGSFNADGSPFEPTIGEQFEVGVKTDFLDGRLSATLAAYQLTRQNDIVNDPDRPGFSIQVGERRSRGIEFDVLGEILPGWNLIASYAYTDAKITEDTTGFEGNRPNNVPRHSGSLWTTYEIQSGDFQGLGFGAGIFVVGDRPGDLANTFDIPSYVRTDAALFYRRNNWQAQLNFQNLFDVDYFESANSINRVVPGPPFTIRGTVSVRF